MINKVVGTCGIP